MGAEVLLLFEIARDPKGGVMLAFVADPGSKIAIALMRVICLTFHQVTLGPTPAPNLFHQQNFRWLPEVFSW